MELEGLQNFDYFIMAIIGFSVYIGWKNGLISSFVTFFAWIGSAIIVIDNYSNVYGFVNGMIHSNFISGFIASVGLYIALVMLFSMLGDKLSKITAKFGGSVTDKVTGIIFGGFCGILIACAIFWCCYMSIFTLNDQKLPKWFAGAKSYKLLKIGSDTISGVAFSEEERQKLINLMKKKGNKLEEEVKKSIEEKKKEYISSEKESEEN
jgi:uncharacterized membrane protein required for colicin V production